MSASTLSASSPSTTLDPTTEPVFDSDQHFYEIRDTFTRHLPSEWQDRTLIEVIEDGRIRHVIGGTLSRTVSNPTFDPIIKPGALMDYFRGNLEQKQLADFLSERGPSPAYYRDPAARLVKMDEQGVEAAWLMPTLGMNYEEPLQKDPEAAGVLFHAFNEWLLEDWTFNYRDRLYVTPYLAMGHVESAVREVDWAAANGARLLVVRPCGVYTAQGWKSPGDTYFDPVWARIAEAGLVVIPHVGTCGSAGLERFGTEPMTALLKKDMPALERLYSHERHIGNYLGALMCDRLFERFPTLRVASVENGSDFLTALLKGLARVRFQRPGYFQQDPVELFQDRVWVQTFWEDNVEEVRKLIPAERILFGSDYPHPEGLPEPRAFWHEVSALPEDEQRLVMYRNAAALTSHGGR